MEYKKPFLSYEEQADLLLKRKLIADKDLLIERLKAVNYYRLSGYLYPFRQSNDEFKPGTTLETVWNRYRFDRQLRCVIMDPIERFEIAVKTKLIYLHANNHGPFGYTNSSTLPLLNKPQFEKFISTIRQELGKNKEPFVRHFRQTYGDKHEDLPIWMAGELMSFGTLFTFFKGFNYQDRQIIASDFGLKDNLLASWFNCINTVRNICAHHSRLWNRELGIKPLIPAKDEKWHKPVNTPNHKIFAVITIFNYLLKIVAPQSEWPLRFRQFLKDHSDIPTNEMGFPNEWESHSLWEL